MVSYLFEPISRYIRKIDTGSMCAVHHYTSMDAAFGILKSGRMWLTERAHLNERSQVWFGLKIAVNILYQRNMASAAAQLVANALNVFGEFRLFSACFSFNSDDISHWRQHADEGKGVMLSFKAQALSNSQEYVASILDGDPTAVACPMSYDNACLERVLGEIIDNWDGNNIRELCDHIFMISGMFKNKGGESENEYRFFVHYQRDKSLRSEYYKARECKCQRVSFLELPIKKVGHGSEFPIWKIVFGPATPDALVAPLRRFVSSMGIPIHEENIVKSGISYPGIAGNHSEVIPMIDAKNLLSRHLAGP
jgi:hypothetical protein